MRLRGLTILAIAGLMAAGGASQLAQAQTFSLENVTAEAGSTVDVRLFVDGGPVDTSALNFTVRYDPEQVTNVSGVRGSAPGITGSYVFDQNSPSASEYRAVLYAQDNSIAPFSTASNAHVATLSVTLASNIADGTNVILTLVNSFDNDGITGLLGISNSAGESIVPGGGDPAQTRPNAVNGTITVTRGSLLDIDFTGREDIPGGFAFNEFPIGPSGTMGLGGEQNEDGYTVTINNRTPNPGRGVDTLYGVVGQTGRITPDAGSVVVTTFDFSSNAPESIRSPFVRLNTRADNFSYATVVSVDETDNVAPFLLPVNNETARFSAAAYVPDFVADPIETTSEGILEGFVVQFEVVNTHITGARERAANGAAITLKRLQVDQVALPENGTILYNETFGAENNGGFTGMAFDGLMDPVGQGTVSQTQDGLVSDLSWKPANERTADISDLAFLYAAWEQLMDGFTVSSDKLYRIDVTVASTAVNNQFAHPFRIRAASASGIGGAGGGGDYISVTAIEPSSRAVDARPTASGTDYSVVVAFPDEANGQPMFLALDTFSANPATTGATIFKSVTITEFDKP